MASKGKILHNQYRLEASKAALASRLQLKSEIKAAPSVAEKLKLMFKLDKNPNKSITRYRRRCQFCGRPRAIMFCNICRIEFRNMANFGQLAGVKKASW